jgi:hypothetical protein
VPGWHVGVGLDWMGNKFRLISENCRPHTSTANGSIIVGWVRTSPSLVSVVEERFDLC